MTKNEKAKQIRTEFEKQGVYPGLGLVSFVLSELEAAGMQWDPEELQLQAFGGHHGYRVGRADLKALHPFTKTEAQEIIRRYEALPKLRPIIAEGPCVCATVQQAEAVRAELLAIIDGKQP